jgi:hypothetical protein
MTDERAHARRYYRDDFEPAPRAITWRRVAFVAAILAMATVSHLGAIWLGFTEGRRVERELQASLPKPAPKIFAPLAQWQCTKQEFAEYRHACARRALNALTPKEK